MICTLTIVRYPKWMGWAGFLSMAIFRLPLSVNKHISFWKLMGSGRNGTFDIHPDWRQWAVLTVGKDDDLQDIIPKHHGGFIHRWWKSFGCETWTLVLLPIEGHGRWDGKEVFGILPRQSGYDGMIGVLTRATIRPLKLKAFWNNVERVARQMNDAPGFITSAGIGEIPWIKQATFSLWENKQAMMQFAYGIREHAAVVRQTHTENWYSEDMFVRFMVYSATGSINGKNPLEGKP